MDRNRGKLAAAVSFSERKYTETDFRWEFGVGVGGNVTGPPGALLFDRDQRSH